jgi:hypothetical protein
MWPPGRNESSPFYRGPITRVALTGLQPAPDPRSIIGVCTAELGLENALFGDDLKACGKQHECRRAEYGPWNREIGGPRHEQAGQAEIHGIAGISIDTGGHQRRCRVDVYRIDGRSGTAKRDQAKGCKNQGQPCEDICHDPLHAGRRRQRPQRIRSRQHDRGQNDKYDGWRDPVFECMHPGMRDDLSRHLCPQFRANVTYHANGARRPTTRM